MENVKKENDMVHLLVVNEMPPLAAKAPFTCIHFGAQAADKSVNI